MLDKLIAEISAYSAVEISAVVLALVYLALAARNNRLCWIAAFISSALFVLVLWQAKLLMDSALNAYYVVMAVYGWLTWSAQNKSNDAAMAITRWPLRFHLLSITAIIALSLLSGFILSTNTQAAFPYLDSLTTWGALLATWMLARRILETWLYWIVLDSLSIYLYFHKDLHFTMALFFFYVGVSIYAYVYWKALSPGPDNPENESDLTPSLPS